MIQHSFLHSNKNLKFTQKTNNLHILNFQTFSCFRFHSFQIHSFSEVVVDVVVEEEG